jgi:hypothetical protein
MMMIMGGAFAGCSSNKQLTGKQYMEKEQSYHNYGASKARWEKAKEDESKKGFLRNLFKNN